MTMDSTATWMHIQKLVEETQTMLVGLLSTAKMVDNGTERTGNHQHGSCASESATPLHLAAAIEEGGHVKMRNLLAEGMDVNACDCNGRTALHIVLSTGKGSTIVKSRLLLEYGADPNDQDDEGITPLSALIQRHNELEFETLLALLLRHGANPNIHRLDPEHNTLLHYAVCKGNIRLVTILIRSGANVNRRNKKGQTPLHLAVGNYGVGLFIITALLEEGRADPFVTDNDGITPLMVICALHSYLPNHINLLLDYVPAPATLYINARDKAGCSGLMHASKKWHGAKRVLFLLEKGANPIQRESDGSNALINLVKNVFSNETLDAIGKLIHAGVHLNDSDNSGKTALHYAAIGKATHAKVLSLLLAYGADPSIRDYAGQVPIVYACLQNDPSNVYILLHAMVGQGSVPLGN